jgi:hypothetical protein
MPYHKVTTLHHEQSSRHEEPTMTTPPRSIKAMPLRYVLGALLAGAIVGMAVACSSDTINDGSGGKPATTTYAQSNCNTCVTSACSTEIDACRGDPGCAAYLDCLGQCPITQLGDADETCTSKCPQGDSTETSKLIADVTICRRQGSGGDCTECGDPGKQWRGSTQQVCPPHDPAPTPCRECYWDKCCDTWNACYDGSNPDCDALATCYGGCTTQGMIESCASACFAAHPNSVPTLLSQLSCAVAQCDSDQVNCDATQRDACDTCLYSTCAQPFQDFFSDPDGHLEWLCLADCGANNGGVTCTEACDMKYPQVETKFLLWAECLEHACASSC